MSDEGKVDAEAVVDFIRTAGQFDWTWETGDVERFSSAARWRPETSADPTIVWATTAARPGSHCAYFDLTENRIKRVAFSVTGIVDPAPPGFLAEAFDQTNKRLTARFGKPDLHESSLSLMSWWRTPKFIIELILAEYSVVVALIKPDDPGIIREIETRSIMTEYIASKWDAFTKTLAIYLSELPSGTKLIVEAVGNKYAQFAQYDTELYAEISGNEFLEEPMTAESEQALIDSGWHAPIKHVEQRGNWYRTISGPSSIEEFTALAHATTIGLRDALQIHTTDDLTAYGWIDGPGELDLTGLKAAVGAIRNRR
ncbi:DUF6301 family protein [Nocardia sp. CA-128927]|uniref:DUF6301 family protein n=1 Tax=Nocardia sp. CA-128927 TaxID=3239975 RepID=UPI003D98DFDB